MRRHLLFLLALISVFAALARGQSTLTQNIRLQIPAYNQTNWQVPYNYDLNLLDSILAGAQILPTGPTPQITQFANWTTANTASTTITNFTNGLSGQTIRIFCGASDTFTVIANSTNIAVGGSWSCPNFLSLTLELVGTVWTEVGRSGGNAAAGVSSWTGDGNFATNSSSTGAVTLALHTAGAHTWWGNYTGSTAAPGYHALTTADIPTLLESNLPATAVFTDQNTTFGAHNYDYSGALTIKVPVSAGGLDYLTFATGQIGYDTYFNNLKAYQNGADGILPTSPVSGTHTNNDCVKFGVVGTGSVTLIDAGTPCYTSTILSISSNYTNSTTSFTNVWPSFSVAASTPYFMTCSFSYLEATSGTFELQITGPASPTSLQINLHGEQLGTAETSTLAFGNSITTIFSTPFQVQTQSTPTVLACTFLYRALSRYAKYDA